MEKLEKVIKPKSIILIKASRPLELEEAVERLQKEVILSKDEVV
ncbi:hypothetical protein [Keratinibaculum paraultunense]|nr:hypothetical protein [Keratinibaculum paraultunense]